MACRGEKPPFTPVWIMRQAGRYLPEYMEIRAKHSFLDLCHSPELATRATVSAVEALGVDAAILFSDILIPMEPMGLPVAFNPGPVIDRPVRTRSDVDALRVPDAASELSFVMEAVAMIRRELDGKVPLIGFAGAPFTLAAYMVEGSGSKDFAMVKALAYKDRTTYDALMAKITDTVIDYLKAQVEAGAHAVQIFDSWGGIVSSVDYRRFVLPWNVKVAEALAGTVPVIYFINNGSHLYETVREIPADVFGIDWRMELDRSWAALGTDRAIQGNLDPAALFAPEEELGSMIDDVLARAEGRPGHIFNLGHGITPTVDPERARFLVRRVHEKTRG
jgi:uroporphyrinogen decarboxylase